MTYLYVPVTALHLISRFTGVDPEHAPLHRLGSGQWQKAKHKAAEKVRDVAAELLGIYAQRAVRQGHVFKHNIEEYQAFAAGFPFEETPDQQNAIDAVLADMTSSKPMDRGQRLWRCRMANRLRCLSRPLYWHNNIIRIFVIGLRIGR